jgi:hypothetical protein
MKHPNVERFNAALQDEGILLKHLSVSDYMKTMDLNKKVTSYLEGVAALTQTLIKEYNKNFNETSKSEEFKKAVEKKNEGKELTESEQKLLEVKPSVTLSNNILSGPIDFIDKLNAIRDIELKIENDLNYISDQKLFKSVVENASPQNQMILFEHLFKSEQTKSKKK